MKKLFVLLTVFATLAHAQKQKIDKYIKEEDVTRIISTLAADDMDGRSALDEKAIGKAAAFIAGEFKKIGLKPLDGSNSFFQEFSTYEKLEILGSEVIVNNAKIPSENIFIYSNTTNIILDSSNPYELIDKDMDFWSLVQGYLSDTIPKVVFIAPQHQDNFETLKRYFSNTRLIEKDKIKKGAIAFVFSNPFPSYNVKAIQKLSPVKLMNVTGMIPGKSKKDEIVIFSGHYDHIGRQTDSEGDSIANGADDDASGTTAVIELANYFSKIKNNNRTLIFVAFTAEEIGAYGSKYFSKQLNPDKVIAMLNIEMIGKPSKWGQNSAFITGFERSDFGEILQKNLAGTEFQFNPDPYPDKNLFYRSDNAILARLGVPAHTISTDEIDIDKFYHTVNDEVETLDMKNITSTIKAIALSSKSIINGKDTPKRIDKSKVD